MATCDHGSWAPDDALNELPDSQAGTGRHKCANCAYRRGYLWGQNNAAWSRGEDSEGCKHGFRAPLDMLAGLPESQAGPGRHKCCICAYRQGFDRARSEATQQQA